MSGDFEPRLDAAGEAGWRARWFHIIFGHQSVAGRRFDILLIWLILASVGVAAPNIKGGKLSAPPMRRASTSWSGCSRWCSPPSTWRACWW